MKEVIVTRNGGLTFGRCEVLLSKGQVFNLLQSNRYFVVLENGSVHMKINRATYNLLFGDIKKDKDYSKLDMREATETERKSVSEYIRGISQSTGVIIDG